MRVIIAGSRNTELTSKEIYQELDKIYSKIDITKVLSGGARGIDTYGEAWAILNKIFVERYTADWNKYGKAAGPIRNRKMAENADALIVFPGGSGTRSMISEARKRNLTIFFVGVDF